MIEYGTDWDNIDLERQIERDLYIVDSLSFESLLTEINCNIKDINIEAVRAQFKVDLESRIESARDVFEANLDNIVKYAIKEREDA